MSSVPLLWVDAGWLLLLAFGYVVVRRELQIVDLRTGLNGGAVPDGLDIGVAVPLTREISEADVLVFLFGDCSSCHELAHDLGRLKDETRVVVVVRDGSVPEAAQSLVRQVPPDIPTHTGDMAERLVDLFKVHSGPLGFAVRKGVIVAKGYLRQVDDIVRLSGPATARKSG